MIGDFFQLIPPPLDQYHGSYDLRLVILSFLVAMFASYIALDFTGRLRDISNTSTSIKLWLMGGAIAMGAGIWSMHFIGMLSFTIPGLTLRYDTFWTAVSLFVAIAASGFALYLLKLSGIPLLHYIAGGIILGFAIASMHYTGMEGMLITLNIKYLPTLFLLSIVVAVVASEAALWFALKSSRVILRVRNRFKLVSAFIMGIAICGMHYTGMAASIFSPLCTPVVSDGGGLDPTLLSMGIAAVTFIILSIAFFASTYKEALNQQQFERARQLGMAEISASVLHNVGNVLNSVNVSANLVSEKMTASKLSGLEKLRELFNEHKENLPEFLSRDSNSENTIKFINHLAEYWKSENKEITEEMSGLNKNIVMIREIINTQQDFSKVNHIENIISINDVLDEILLITGLNMKPDIEVEKHYGKMDLVKVDKVKLFQVMINLLRNARDSVMESSQVNKIISIKSYVKNDRVIIEVSDNGLGIPAKSLNRIFNYGYTTKESGHGFGLHTAALAVNSMGGEITAQSEGVGKGATFIVKLPNKKLGF